MLVQSEPHSHTEYVHFEPSPVMVSLGYIKDFHVVRAEKEHYLSFIESSHSLCLDKREIILAQIQACNRLLKHAKDESDRGAINRELGELKLTLDMMHY